MSKNINFLIMAGSIAMTSTQVSSVSMADSVKEKNILNTDDVQEKLSRKHILPSDEDIAKMDEEQLLDEIKLYDSDIVDMMENINIVNNQINTLEMQIKSLNTQINTFSKKDKEIQKDNKAKTSELNKIKALLSLPSISITEEKKSEINNAFNLVSSNESMLKKINMNSNSLEINSIYKENYLEQVQKMKSFLDKESFKVAESKKKVNARIEELSKRDYESSNPYASQGNNVSIPENLNSSELVNHIIEITAKQIGIPYLWGGTSPKGFDCSGLLQYSFGKAGVSIPRTARQQQKYCQKISYNQLKPGDLVFWNSPATHVALYIGEDKIIEAPRTGLNVRSRKIKTSEKGINFGRIFV